MSTNASLVSGCAGFWNCNEVSGTRVDSTGNNNLTVIGSVPSTAFNPNFNPGIQPDLTASFDGTSSNSLTITDNTKLRMGDKNYTICGWFRRPLGTVTFLLVGKGGGQGAFGQIEYGMGFFSGFGLYFNCYAASVSSVSAIIPNTLVLDPLKWYFLVGRKIGNGGPAQIKMNNGDWTTTNSGVVQWSSSTSQFAVGAEVNNVGTIIGNGLNGNICNVGIWNRFLTDSECGDLWNGGYGLDYPFGFPV